MKNPAFVFNCHFNGLSIIQSLGRNKIPVFALDNHRSIGTYSKYAKYLKCPEPLENEEDFINFLLRLRTDFSEKPVLFPTNDQWASAVSKHKEELEKLYIPCVADWQTVELVLNKDLFTRWAMERAIPVAKLYDRNEITDEMFPVIVKPKYRRISNLNKSNINMSKELDNRRITVIKNSHELNNYVQENVTILPYIMFQEHIPGMADCMYTVGIYANKEYEVLGVFEGRKVRGFPPDIGDCVVGQSEKLPPGIVDLVKETVKELHLSGITEFEFKKNPDTGEFRLIEINPRSWSWIGITPACGVDLPLIAYNDLTGKHETYKESMYDHGDVKYIKLIDDFKNCLYKNKKAGFDQYHMGLKQWWVSLKAKKCMFAGFEKNDILPGLFQIIQMLKNK